MGDRGNIVVRQWGSNAPVVLYTHWAGSEITQIAAKALDSPQGRGRWTDEAYLARIVFDVLTEGQHGEETGFGISTAIGDNGHPVVVIDPASQRVNLVQESHYAAPVLPHEGMTFQEFIDAYGGER